MATKNGGSFVRDGNKPAHPIQQQQSQSSDDSQPHKKGSVPDPKTVQANARRRLQRAKERD